MKKTLIALGAVVVVVIAAALIVPTLIPLESYKEEITARVRDATGRELTLAGDIRLSLIPSVELEVEEVSFSNATGAAEPQMATLSSLLLKLEILPLLVGSVEIDSFVLVDPVINLEIGADGRANWEFDVAADAPDVAEAEPVGEAPGGAEESEAPAISEISLGDVRIENGLVTFRDAKGAEVRISDIDMRLELESLDSPFEAEGGLVYNGERLEIEAVVDTPARLMAQERARVEVALASNPVNLAFEGAVTLGDVLAATGAVTLKVPSVRGLAEWAGAPIALEGSGLGPLEIEGKVAVEGAAYTFSDASVAFDEIKGTGGVTIDLGGKRPRIEAMLDVDRLDVNPYLPPEKEDAAGAGTGEGASEGGKEPADWSDEKINFSPLKLVDADLAFSAGAFLFRKIKIGRSVVTVRLKGGDLVVDLTEMELYGGAGKMTVRINASKTVPVLEKSIHFTGVNVEPLLRDAADFDRLSGTGEIELTVTGKGRTEREFVSSLAGKGRVMFLDGAIKGINLAAMARNVTTAFTAGGDAEKTDFAELSGTVVIKKGVVKNKDLKMLAPLVRLAGAGKVNLPKRRLKYRFEPKLVADSEGQGGAADVAGLMVPVIAEGPWHDISYRPDLKGLVEEGLKDPSAVVDAIEGAKDAPEDIIKGLLGDGSGEDGGSGGEEVLEGLKSLFGN